jgi:hypothetical protein
MTRHRKECEDGDRNGRALAHEKFWKLRLHTVDLKRVKTP